MRLQWPRHRVVHDLWWVIAESVMGRMNAPAMPLPVSPVDDWPFLAWELNYEAEAQAAHLVSDLL
ncbi:hypothetical protein HFO93_27810 [Rhizobium leguminosarum]|uniref:hypothetical protein n=1 Tax=Rhizobium leguminosarum TaxID=384 RepID=UPI001C973BD7|nr:hypothetical protein [Rhizobium leguminosarum]MBY5447190.1 hypothetical protein [Rhizobium leguminosarum]